LLAFQPSCLAVHLHALLSSLPALLPNLFT
jgi:hypothetical protein